MPKGGCKSCKERKESQGPHFWKLQTRTSLCCQGWGIDFLPDFVVSVTRHVSSDWVYFGSVVEVIS